MTVKTYTKAQIEIGETIMVLFIVTILIAIGIFFYYQYTINSISTAQESLTEQKYSIFLSSILSMPEIKCDKEECIDATKLFIFRDFLKDPKYKNYYTPILGQSKITIEQIYPEINSKEECTPSKYQSFNYPDNCKYWLLYSNPSNKKPFIISTPISLYFPDAKEFRIGKLKIEVYL